MPELMEVTPVRALAIYAHPDDPDVGCGGTLAAWSAKGCEVHVLLCTDGDKGSTDASVEPRELATRRAVEAAESASLIGLAGQESLHFPDGELADDLGLQRALVEVVRRLRPDVVHANDITMIGVVLMRVGVNWAGGGAGKADFGAAGYLAVAALVLAIILLVIKFTAAFCRTSRC